MSRKLFYLAKGNILPNESKISEGEPLKLMNMRNMNVIFTNASVITGAFHLDKVIPGIEPKKGSCNLISVEEKEEGCWELRLVEKDVKCKVEIF